MPNKILQNAVVNDFFEYRNKIINGNFDIWQRATSQTVTGYGSDDRWINGHNVTTKTHSMQAFTLGQTEVPGNPVYYSRTVVSSVAGAGNYCVKQQRIENVVTFSGKKITLTFYAKADAVKNIGIEFTQSFGVGGSTTVSLPLGLITLSTSWKRYDVVVDIPSIVGKTIADANSFIEVDFWLDAGSVYAARSSNLGQQNITFDLARVSVVEGDARGEADPFSPRHLALEFIMCQRYFQKIVVEGITGITYIPNGDTRAFIKLNTKMRTASTVTVSPTNLVVIASGDLNSTVNADIGNMTIRTTEDCIRITNVSQPGQLGNSSANVASWGCPAIYTFSVSAEL